MEDLIQKKKPFVRLFRTPNSFYCLDVNSNEVLELGPESFRYLAQLLRGREAEGEAPVQIRQLKSMGYLSEESNVKQVRHALTDYLGDYLNRRLLKLTLQVTQNCNFRCRYCVYSEEHNKGQRSHSLKNMSWETAKKAVDFLWEHSPDSTQVNIGFYGGEPLFRMDLIRRVIEYSEELFAGKELSFSMTTNGTLLDEELVLYLEEHGVILMVSLDGSKEINDRNRVLRDGTGTYDLVMQKIEMVRKVAPEYAAKMQISMVMDPENDFDCFNSIYVEEKDFDELFVAAAIVDKEYDWDEPEVSEAYRWKSNYQRFLGLLSYIGRVHKCNVSPIIYLSVMSDLKRRFEMDLYSKLFETDAPGGPCVPGQLRLFCNVDEKLFPCERVSETSAVSCIGSLDNGFDLKNAQRFLNVGQVTEEECKHCWSFRYCTLCGKRADAGQGKMEAGEKRKHCSESHASAEAKFRERLLLQEIPVYYSRQVSGVHEESIKGLGRPGNTLQSASGLPARKRAVLYPFCPEALPAVKLFEGLQEEYSLRYLVSPKGFGYAGRDAAYACNHPEIGMKVLDEIPFEAEDWDTLILFEPVEKKGDFFPEKVLRQAAASGKQVILCPKGQHMPWEMAKTERAFMDKAEMKTFRMEKMAESGRKVHEPSVPVVLVGGLLEEADCFEVFLRLAVKLKSEGWNLAAFSKHPLGALFGFYGLSHIWENAAYTEEEKIRRMNLYINDVAKHTCANLILLEAPDSFMKHNDAIPNGYGIRTFMLCQAVTPDYLVCCVPFEMTDGKFLESIGQDLTVRLGCGISAVHASNVMLDIADTMQKEQVQILRGDMDCVRRRLEGQGKNSAIPIFNVVEDGIDALAEVLTDENGE